MRACHILVAVLETNINNADGKAFILLGRSWLSGIHITMPITCANNNDNNNNNYNDNNNDNINDDNKYQQCKAFTQLSWSWLSGIQAKRSHRTSQFLRNQLKCVTTNIVQSQPFLRVSTYWMSNVFSCSTSLFDKDLIPTFSQVGPESRSGMQMIR